MKITLTLSAALFLTLGMTATGLANDMISDPFAAIEQMDGHLNHSITVLQSDPLVDTDTELQDGAIEEFARIEQRISPSASMAHVNQVNRPDLPTARLLQEATRMDSIRVDQSGDPQAPMITQVAHLVTVGTMAQSGLDMTGTHSTAVIFQQGAGNVADILQDTMDLIGSDIVPVGNSNLAIISQINDENPNAAIDENADENAAFISQSNGTNLTAAIYQRGAGHTADIDQTNEFNLANISQIGLNHQATIHQSGQGTAGFENLAIISQTGVTGHTATITQAGGRNNVATITQSD